MPHFIRIVFCLAPAIYVELDARRIRSRRTKCFFVLFVVANDVKIGREVGVHGASSELIATFQLSTDAIQMDREKAMGERG